MKANQTSNETPQGPDLYRAASIHENQEAHNWLHSYLKQVTPRNDLDAMEAHDYPAWRAILAEPVFMQWEILKAADIRLAWNMNPHRLQNQSENAYYYVAALRALIRGILLFHEEKRSPDGYDVDPTDPLAEEHRRLNRFLVTFHETGTGWFFIPPDDPDVMTFLKTNPETQVKIFRACLIRLDALKPHAFRRGTWNSVLEGVRDHLMLRKLPYRREDMLAILEIVIRNNYAYGWIDSFLKHIERHIAEEGGVYPELRAQMESLRALRSQRLDKEALRRQVLLDELLGYRQRGMMGLGEPWADAALAEIATLEAATQAKWVAVLAHAQKGDGSKPTAKWTAEAIRHLAALGEEEFKRRIPGWFALTVQESTEPFEERNATFLRGLALFCSLLDDAALCRAVGTLGEAAYKKLANGELRATRVGNACVYTLSLMPGWEPIAQLARLQFRVKARQALYLIGRTLDAAAEKSGLSREELAEITVPTYGLNAGGVLRETFGDFTAEMSLSGKNAHEWRWHTPSGKPQKSVSAEVKRDHAAAWKALKGAGDEMLKMLPPQRDRIERLFLFPRTWTLAAWRGRYLDHPLLLHFARRLIWEFRIEGRSQLGLWRDGRMADAAGQPMEGLTEETQVLLWHPVQSDSETVLQWRQWLEAQEIVQPFKQAHREIYLLTDAEITTRTYSNRFAAHILRQPQFNALCSQRGWQYRLQMIHDNNYDKRAILPLPQWAVNAEFWTDPIEGNYQTDATDAGTWHYLTTDQVRFCSAAGMPLPLSEVPPQVFSEVMRDVDLFVAVASIGADPNWANRGTDRERDPARDRYWESYSFGELSASALTRRDLLQRLLPRLKIASLCALDGKFLTVRGDIRSYKIHLGSGNILMEPNNQYLCIVPARGAEASVGAGTVFLPFEGDSTLSAILSKAFLLAEDTKITDTTITRQIGRSNP